MHYKSSNFHMNVLYYVGLTLGTQELSYLRHSYIEKVPYWTLTQTQEPLHSDAMQALAGGTLSALVFEIADQTKWCCFEVTSKVGIS